MLTDPINETTSKDRQVDVFLLVLVPTTITLVYAQTLTYLWKTGSASFMPPTQKQPTTYKNSTD